MFQNKRILIIGDSLEDKTNMINLIIKEVGSYNLFEEIRYIDNVKRLLKKPIYNTTIVSTAQLYYEENLANFDLIVMFSTKNKKLKNHAINKWNIDISNLADGKFKIYKQN